MWPLSCDEVQKPHFLKNEDHYLEPSLLDLAGPPLVKRGRQWRKKEAIITTHARPLKAVA